jgi:hypothetical protein
MPVLSWLFSRFSGVGTPLAVNGSEVPVGLATK